MLQVLNGLIISTLPETWEMFSRTVFGAPTLTFAPLEAQLVLAVEQWFGEAAAQERKCGSTNWSSRERCDIHKWLIDPQVLYHHQVVDTELSLAWNLLYFFKISISVYLQTDFIYIRFSKHWWTLTRGKTPWSMNWEARQTWTQIQQIYFEFLWCLGAIFGSEL